MIAWTPRSLHIPVEQAWSCLNCDALFVYAPPAEGDRKRGRCLRCDSESVMPIQRWVRPLGGD